jgi:hypothetical protein
MPKINRKKLLEYLETEYSEELELSDILRSCEVEGYEERYVSEVLRKVKVKR